MPELPEVETTARSLREHLVGRRAIAAGGVDWPRMLPNSTAEEISALLGDHAVVGVDRRGKYLLVEFEGGLTLGVHRKMSGNLLLVPKETEVYPHTHFVLDFDDNQQLRLVDMRKFGRVYLFRTPAELGDFLDARLGPEPLGTELDARILQTRLARRTVPIKTALLDQSVLAGVGNLYADEALWEARIHPLQPANSLSLLLTRRLVDAVRHVLEQAILQRGTSFSTYLDADGSEGSNQNFLHAYAREGQPCPRCGTAICRIRIGQRSSYFCPHDQRLRRAAAREPTPRSASQSGMRSGTGRPRPGAATPDATAPAPPAAGGRR
jgi:formamidopyrimidine-DNA glycosylase